MKKRRNKQDLAAPKSVSKKKNMDDRTSNDALRNNEAYKSVSRNEDLEETDASASPPVFSVAAFEPKNTHTDRVNDNQAPTIDDAKSSKHAPATLTTGPHSTSESGNQANKAPICIDVVGDIFIETFIWPQGINTELAQSLPYTWPDELRSSGSAARFRELSGSPLHAEIYKQMLAVEELKQPEGSNPLKDEWIVTSYPKFSNCDEHTLKMDGGPFPVYLHELASFPRCNSNKAKVWRIAKSHGELRSGFTPESDTYEALKGTDEERKLGIKQSSKALRDEVSTWLTNLPNQKNTIIVINDRNALKEQDESSSVRSLLTEIATDLFYKNASGDSIKNETEFRDDKSTRALSTEEALIPIAESLKKIRPLVVWQTRSPLFENDSVDKLLTLAGWIRSTIPIINFNCLRDAGLPLRFDVSYETALQTLLESLTSDNTSNAVLQQCKRFPHVLIRFDYGIVHISFDENKNLTGLDLHGINAADQSFEPTEFGMMLGTTPLLVGAILVEALRSFSNYSSGEIAPVDSFLSERYIHPTILNPTSLDRAIDTGLLLSAMHFTRGYGSFEPMEWPKNFRYTTEATRQKRPCSAGSYGDLYKTFLSLTDYKVEKFLRINKSQLDRDFPSANLARLSVEETLLKPGLSGQNATKTFTRIDLFDNPKVVGKRFPNELTPHSNWKQTFQCVLRAIVENGLASVAQSIPASGFVNEPSIFCPYVELGKVVSVDKDDIDSLLSLRNLVLKYIVSTVWTTPLAIAVFGRPGTGKGFFVSEALNGIGRGLSRRRLEFNLSQWNGSIDVSRAFHAIQDLTLEGEIPIAFFDEFDCTYQGEQLEWLRHFLMPIQDGRYIEDGNVFHLGKSIFVFAGGTASRYQDFYKKNIGQTEKKVPDFLSRLRAYIDVADCDYIANPNDPHENAGPLASTRNKLSAVRRAILLRSLLKKNTPQIFDPGSEFARVHNDVIDSFLGVPSFTHGARSIEAIIQMSKLLPSSTSFHPSALPTREQLSLHVDAVSFLNPKAAWG